MSVYSQLPIYNSIFFILRDLYERVPKFSKQYKYLLGEKMIGCCIDSIVLINQVSEEKDNEKKITYVSEINKEINKLLTYIRVANELNQLGKENAYFFLSEKIVDVSNQTENWKKFLTRKDRPCDRCEKIFKDKLYKRRSPDDGLFSLEDIPMIQSYLGHFGHADSYNLRKRLGRYGG